MPSINNLPTESLTQECIIRRLAERDAEIRTITQQNLSLENSTLAAKDVIKTQEAVINRLNNDNEDLILKAVETDRTVKSLKDEVDERDAEIRTITQQKLSLEKATLAAKDVIKKKDALIKSLNNDKEDLILKATETDRTVKSLKAEVAKYQDLIAKGKALGDGQITVLLEKEKSIEDLEDKNAELEEQIKALKHTIESKDAILDMQRQEMGIQEVLIDTFERKFQAKDVDVPSIVARADESERIWSKIEEREQKYLKSEITNGALRDENASLRADKERLQVKIRELKDSFELLDLDLSGTDDRGADVKIDTRWLLTQLRESIGMKEKIMEQEHIIQSEGYTVRVVEAESGFKKKERESIEQLEKLTQIITALKGQVSDDIEVPALIGKLEECLLVFGYDPAHIEDIPSILSEYSTYSDHSMPFISDCECSFDENMSKKASCVNWVTEGLCRANNEMLYRGGYEDYEEEEQEYVDCRDDISDARADVDPSVAEELSKDDEGAPPSDVHLEKVLKILDRSVDELSLPPPSPSSCITATAE